MNAHEERLQTLARYVSPTNPIRTTEFLRGRDEELTSLEQELRYFQGIPFIFGNRGVGKTSLARTVAQQITSSDYEHVYAVCGPGVDMLAVLQGIGQDLLRIALRYGNVQELTKRVEVNISINPSVKIAIEKRLPQLPEFPNANAAVRVLKEIDDLLPANKRTVVIIDELEELKDDADRKTLAFLVKQAGDQEFRTRFVLVGIAENVQQLIGAHQSVPRYIKEMALSPLSPQVLMDIVSDAATHVGIGMGKDLLYRIAIIGNGYPHFAHLMGKTILTEAIVASIDRVRLDSEIYEKGVTSAVRESHEELRMSYEAATQRGDNVYKHLLWALANQDLVDVLIDDWVRGYEELERQYHWAAVDEKRIRNVIGLLNQSRYGAIVANTPLRYGSHERRNRYKRFSHNLMRGHVRLRAENDRVRLGSLRTS
jgi:uncharacterized protein